MNIHKINGPNDTQEQVVSQKSKKSDVSILAPFGSSFCLNANKVPLAKDGEVSTYNIKDVSCTNQKDDNDTTKMFFDSQAADSDALVLVEDNLEEEDVEELSAEGKVLSEFKEEALTRALTRVRLSRMLNQERIENTVERSKEEQENIKQIAISSKLNGKKSRVIIEKLQDLNLTISDELVNEIEESLNMWEESQKVDKDISYYLIKNKLNPTIQNIYKAKFSGNQKEVSLNSEAWNQMQETVSSLIKEAGLLVLPETLNNARMLVEHSIPLTTSNLLIQENLQKTQELSLDNILDLIIDSKAQGKQAIDTIISDSLVDTYDKVLEFNKINDGQILLASKQAIDNSEGFLNLRKIQQTKNAQVNSNKNVQKSPIYIKAKLSIEEIRLKLTADSAIHLAKRGISLDLAPLESIVDELRQLEQKYFTNLLEETEAPVNEANLRNITTISTTLQSLKLSPAYILGSTFEIKQEITVESLANEGIKLTDEFKKANQAYEALMTKPRYDMGDSIRKAFKNIDSILDDLNLEITESNQRAVRILGYNQMEISPNSITQMKAYDSIVQNMFSLLTPSVVSKMVKDGYNPLDHTMDEVVEKCQDYQDDKVALSFDQYARFLYDLEHDKAISPDERKEYISIFRALKKIENSDGAAIGAVIRNGEELNLSSLLRAVKSANSKGINRIINDEFGLLISNDNQDNSYNLEYSKSFRESFKELQNEGELLRTLQIPDSLNMKAAMNNLLTNNNFYSSLSLGLNINSKNDKPNTITDSSHKGTNILRDESPVLANSINGQSDIFDSDSFEKLEEALFTEGTTLEEFDSSYNELLHDASLMLDNILNNSIDNSLDLKALQGLYQGIRLRSSLTKNKYYEIPLAINEKLACINLSLVGSSEKGSIKINIPSENGDIYITVNATENELNYSINSNSFDNLQTIEESIQNIENALVTQGFINVTRHDEQSLLTKNQRNDSLVKNFKQEALSQSEMPSTVDTEKLYQVAKTFIINLLDN